MYAKFLAEHLAFRRPYTLQIFDRAFQELLKRGVGTESHHSGHIEKLLLYWINGFPKYEFLSNIAYFYGILNLDNMFYLSKSAN